MDEKEKTIIFELDDDDSVIVRPLLDKESPIREEIFDMLTPGKATITSMKAFVYTLIYILNNYSNDKVNVQFCINDPNAEPPKYSVVVTIDYPDFDKGELIYVPDNKDSTKEKENK